MRKYTIHKTEQPPKLTGEWNDAIWSQAETLKIEYFHPRSSSHRPAVQARLLYDANNIYVHFKVTDQYVRSVTIKPQGPVCQDSCVEFFFKPKPDRGYLNVEANCGGTFLCSYIEDHRRTPGCSDSRISTPPRPPFLPFVGASASETHYPSRHNGSLDGLFYDSHVMAIKPANLSVRDFRESGSAPAIAAYPGE